MKQTHKKKRMEKKALQKRKALTRTVQKKTVSALQLRKISRELLNRFPAAVDDESLRLVLLDVDPHMIHAYWNVPLSNGTAIPPESEKRLRIYHMPDMIAPLKNALSWFEVPVQGLCSQQYIDVDRDNAVYVAQLGFTRPGGRFIPIVTSNRVQTPPAVRLAASRTTIFEHHAVRQYAHEHAESLAQDIFAALASSSVPRPAVLLDEEYIDSLIRQRLHVQHDILACEDLRPAPAWPRSEPHTRPGSVSSISVFRQNEAAGLRAELVIEGRVRPGTRLMLHGRQVRPEPDGRFRIRYKLPVDERLFRLLKSADDFGQPAEGNLVVTAIKKEAVGDKVQLEMFASVHVYGRAVDRYVVAGLGPEVVTLPDGRIYLKRILPHGIYIPPELLVAAPQEGNV